MGQLPSSIALTLTPDWLKTPKLLEPLVCVRSTVWVPAATPVTTPEVEIEVKPCVRRAAVVSSELDSRISGRPMTRSGPASGASRGV